MLYHNSAPRTDRLVVKRNGMPYSGALSWLSSGQPVTTLTTGGEWSGAVAFMDFSLSERQNTFVRNALAYARSQLCSPIGAGENQNWADESQDQGNRDRWRVRWGTAAAKGFAGLPIPPEFGGRGYSALDTCLVIEALGKGGEDRGFLFSLAAHTFAAAVPLWKAGESSLRTKWLPRLAQGELIAAGAASEAEAGSDLFSLTTSATKKGNFYLLEGEKCHITNATVADVFLVYARTNPKFGSLGISIFLVPRSTPGLTIESGPQKIGLRNSPWGRVRLSGCEIPESNRVGPEGAGASLFQESMRWERICLHALAVGAMDSTLEKCVEHVRTRRQFDRPIGSFQSVSNKIVDMSLRLETSRLLLYRAAWLHSQGQPCDEQVSQAKLWISESAAQSGLDAVQLFGAAGISSESGIDSLIRDALPLRIASGTSEIHRHIIARCMGIS